MLHISAPYPFIHTFLLLPDGKGSQRPANIPGGANPSLQEPQSSRVSILLVGSSAGILFPWVTAVVYLVGQKTLLDCGSLEPGQPPLTYTFREGLVKTDVNATKHLPPHTHTQR